MSNDITDRRWTPTDVVNPITAATDFTPTQDIRTLDTRLVVINAAYWTAFRLAAECVNDKIFWLRCQTPAGLA
jgi:hypothetical protein